MYSNEDRIRAVELYIKLGKRVAETIHQLGYRAISAEALADDGEARFDVVTCMEMLEHVPSPEAVIEACARMARPGGWVFFSTINRTPWAWLIAIFGAEQVLRILPRGTHDYRKLIRPEELKQAAVRVGLELRDQHGLGYNPLTRKFKLHRSLRVGYLLAMQKKTDGNQQ